MKLESLLRLIGGAMVILTVLLAIYVHPAFLWGTLFVGLNLFQSGLTNWCPIVPVLRKYCVRDQPTGQPPVR